MGEILAPFFFIIFLGWCVKFGAFFIFFLGWCVKLRVLCCTVLCCAVLYCAVLCCAVLCCAVLYCDVLCCAVRVAFSGEADANRCPLCHNDIRPGVDGWKEHLLQQGCPQNERTHPSITTHS